MTSAILKSPGETRQCQWRGPPHKLWQVCGNSRLEAALFWLIEVEGPGAWHRERSEVLKRVVTRRQVFKCIWDSVVDFSHTGLNCCTCNRQPLVGITTRTYMEYHHLDLFRLPLSNAIRFDQVKETGSQKTANFQTTSFYRTITYKTAVWLSLLWK